SVEKQVAIIYLGTNGLLRDVPVDKVSEFEEMFLTEMEKQHQSILDNFRKGKLNEDDLEVVKTIAANLSKQYKK
ncbi:MAG: F0F1 ATP synthase subunit alpha, partial [Saprospiraceae bacterium]|nr:F0F1 ATP synthase subunit alpha [Saprospiraceae bacterium]